MKITIMSDGAWGTAVALVLLRNNHDVTIWGPFPDYLEQMRAERQNPRFLAGIDLPEELKLEGEVSTAIAGISTSWPVVPVGDIYHANPQLGP